MILPPSRWERPMKWVVCGRRGRLKVALVVLIEVRQHFA